MPFKVRFIDINVPALLIGDRLGDVGPIRTARYEEALGTLVPICEVIGIASELGWFLDVLHAHGFRLTLASFHFPQGPFAVSMKGSFSLCFSGALCDFTACLKIYPGGLRSNES